MTEVLSPDAADFLAVHRFVILGTLAGVTIAVFHTDRTSFPAFATYARDRVFQLQHEGDLAQMMGMTSPVQGAVYIEVDPWRISGATLNEPKPRKRRRKSAKIFQFPPQVGDAA